MADSFTTRRTGRLSAPAALRLGVEPGTVVKYTLQYDTYGPYARDIVDDDGRQLGGNIEIGSDGVTDDEVSDVAT